MDRRTFVLGAAGLGAAALAGGVLAGCAGAGAAGGASAGSASAGAPSSGVAPPEDTRPYDSAFPQHGPYGRGVGVHPGRVAWVRDPASVEWDGSGYWWQRDHFDEAVVRRMVEDGLTELAGAASAAEAWFALFSHHNEMRGRTGGYRSGEKIAIKANMNGAGLFGEDEDSAMSYTTPVLLRALLLSLVKDAGVAPADITVCDACRIFPQHVMELCSEGALAGVHFRHYDMGGANDAVPDAAAPLVWSQEFEGASCVVPTCVSEASYLINLASLKGHSYGLTLCGKNHFGTLMNSDRLRPPQAAGVHRFLTNRQMGAYTVLVDLLANHLLGGKTVLWMLDGLVAATSEGASVTREAALWESAPFDGGFTASVFLSQDPVALDSVGADFLMNEPAVTGRNSSLAGNLAVENYLHEAGLVAAPPSGATYLDGAGGAVENLGVHEHWNNATERLYSRNLGKPEGIELVRVLRAGA